MKLNEVTIVESRQSLVEAQMYESRKILIESMSGLTTKQRKVVYEFYNGFEPLIAELRLMEATLSADQIQQIFGNVEQGATASGSNRTMVGKGVDAAKLPGKVVSAIDDKINELGRMVQNAGPIKNIDAKFEELKKKISTDNPEVAKRIKSVSDWAKANPGKASLAVGILTAAAAFAAGPAGGAAAGFFLRSANELLKGEKLSTAVGKSVKTAAYGAMAGWALEGIGDWLEGIRADVIPYDKAPGIAKVDVNLTHTLEMPGYSFKDTILGIFVPEDMVPELQALVEKAAAGDVDAFREISMFADSFDVNEYLDNVNAINAVAKEVAQQNDAFLQGMTKVNDAVAALAQGSIQGKFDSKDVKVEGEPVQDGESKKESTEFYKSKLSEGQVYLVFNTLERIQILSEAEAEQDAKPAPEGEPEQKEKKPGFFSRMGKNLTTKITADKLNKAWKKAGSPTDSNELANFLRQQGVNDEVITPVYKQMKLKVPAAPKQTDPNAKQDNATKAKDGGASQTGGATGGKTSPTGQTGGAGGKKAAQGFSYNDVKAHIAKLTAKDKRRLLKYLGRSQPSSTTTKAPAKKPATQPAGIKQGGYQTTGPTA